MNDKEQMEKDWCDLARKWTTLIDWDIKARVRMTAGFLLLTLLGDLHIFFNEGLVEILSIILNLTLIYMMVQDRNISIRDRNRWLRERQYCLDVRDVIRLL